MWPPGLPHGILCTRLQYVHIEAWYTGSFGVARIPAGYVLKNQNLKKLRELEKHHLWMRQWECCSCTLAVL